MSKKKILIIGLNQLPHRYLENLCRHLAATYNITVLSPYEGLEKKGEDFVQTVYFDLGVPKAKLSYIKKLKTFIRMIRFVIMARRFLKNKNYELIYIWDMTWAFLIKFVLGGKHRYVMQIFTPGVRPNKLKNKMQDLQVKFNTHFFKHIFVGTEIMQRFFSIPAKKTFVVGGVVEAIEFHERVFTSMDLVYLGGLTNRSVHETVEGFARFHEAHKHKIAMSYTIIGGGTAQAVNELKDRIKNLSADVPVRYLGRLNDAELPQIFEHCNIGVVYARITPYFTNNVSTKFYEYLNSGMPVIATRHNTMLTAINDINGVLIEDSPEGFAQGLEAMLNRLGSYDSQEIVKTAVAYSGKTVEDKMIPSFNAIMMGER